MTDPVKITITGELPLTLEITILPPQTPPDPEEPEEPVPTPVREGVWVDPDALQQLPTSGAPWEALLKVANSTFPTPKVSNQDSTHSRYTLASALAGVRLADDRLLQKAEDALKGAIGTEGTTRWLAVGRNLGAYIIAADVMGIHSGPVHEWLASFRTRTLPHNNSGKLITLHQSAWESGSNASAQEGFVYSALCAYLGDKQELAWNWDAFRRYCGDRTSPHTITSNNHAWQEKPEDPVGIQNVGAKSEGGVEIAGAVSNDMSRSNSTPKVPLSYVSASLYPWVGLNGAGFAATVLKRKGYDAFGIREKALLRAVKFLREVAVRDDEPGWWGADKKEDVKWMLCRTYGLKIVGDATSMRPDEYPIRQPVGMYDLVGFTDWTHPQGA